jgi:hypothetical protein
MLNECKRLITIHLGVMFPRILRRVFGIKKWVESGLRLLLKGRGGFMSSLRRTCDVVVLMLALLMIHAIPSAAQAHGSANAHPPTFTTAAPANTGSQYQPLTEPNNVPPVLVTPLTSYSDLYPGFGRDASGSIQEAVRPESRVQERTEDLIQPQPKIGER